MDAFFYWSGVFVWVALVAYFVAVLGTAALLELAKRV